MTRNIGPRNRAARAIYGLVGIALAAYGLANAQWAVALIGVLIALFGIGQAATGVCVFHAAKGTCDMR